MEYDIPYVAGIETAYYSYLYLELLTEQGAERLICYIGR